MKPNLLLFILFFPLSLFAQLTPEVTSWIINTTGSTGYNNIPSNVQLVQYSSNWVYVSCTAVPDYSIGPWPGNPNTPVNQNFVFKISRSPVQNAGTPVATPMGHIGVWSNGVSIFNAKDGVSYNNQGIWFQNAIVSEGTSFDNCLGHPAPNSEYHHHLNPTCLYDDHDSSVHSPIIGYAFDGFPIYGAYAFETTNGTGNITRMKSSYQVRNITTRTTLPNGTTLNASQYGPAVSVNYPLGFYLEDFEYIAGLGDLDEHNGRFSVTPEYPQGTYAYFVTLDAQFEGEFPYVLGPTYYGTVAPGNTGPNSGHNTITEPVTVYNPASGVNELSNSISFTTYPNPANNYLFVYVDASASNNLTAYIFNSNGKVLHHMNNLQPTITYTFDFTNYAAGIYFLKLMNEDISVNKKVVVAK